MDRDPDPTQKLWLRRMKPFDQITVIYIGAFIPEHSTENEIRRALESLGVTVRTFEEGEPGAWPEATAAISTSDVVLWTRTAGNLKRIPHDVQQKMVARAHDRGVPVIGYHLDIWWGLARQREVLTEPYFRLVDRFCSADGGHDEQWAEIGVAHRWFPPAVSEFECVPGFPKDHFEHDVVFVGSWQGGYHEESVHRFDLVNHLRREWNAEFYPRDGQPAVRGDDLRDLYASVKIAVGDSCLSNGRYCSDRIPETTGRGAFLAHPYTEQVIPGLWQPDEHLGAWHEGEWDQLDDLLGYYLGNDSERVAVAKAGREHTLLFHTYTVRMRQLFEMMDKEGLL